MLSAKRKRSVAAESKTNSMRQGCRGLRVGKNLLEGSVLRKENVLFLRQSKTNSTYEARVPMLTEGMMICFSYYLYVDHVASSKTRTTPAAVRFIHSVARPKATFCGHKKPLLVILLLL